MFNFDVYIEEKVGSKPVHGMVLLFDKWVKFTVYRECEKLYVDFDKNPVLRTSWDRNLLDKALDSINSYILTKEFKSLCGDDAKKRAIELLQDVADSYDGEVSNYLQLAVTCLKQGCSDET